MPRKQRFKPSRKPKPTNEEVGTSPIDQQTRAPNAGERIPERERQEIVPEDLEGADLGRVNGSPTERQE